MKKTWVKREHIYYKPFYKQKSKMMLLFIFVLAIVFFVYQALTINQLPNISTPWSNQELFDGIRAKHKQMQKSLGIKERDYRDAGAHEGNDIDDNKSEDTSVNVALKIIRGTRLFDFDSYKPNYDGNFKCLDGSFSIPFDHVNDDYCDCIRDGSDEPSTNACANGKFYCKFQKRHITGRGLDVFVLSSRVNDGVCDCCDGSDEWTTSIKCKNKCLN